MSTQLIRPSQPLFQETASLLAKWTSYADSRRATYEFRAETRYKAAAHELMELGLFDKNTVVDVGAGSTQFDYYLRTACGFRGRYLPIDAVLDGTDLEVWEPRTHADFFVALEVLEHLHNPWRMMQALEDKANVAVIATVPNPEVVDVLACDPTHVSVITLEDFWKRGWSARPIQLFNQPKDSILAVWAKHIN